MGEQLPCKREICDNKNRYVAAVLRDRTTVGHMPRKTPAACTLFLQREGSNYCVVTNITSTFRTAQIAENSCYTNQRPHPLIFTMNDFILADFNLAVGWSIHQTAKFNSLPNFLAIQYMCTHPHSHVVLP